MRNIKNKLTQKSGVNGYVVFGKYKIAAGISLTGFGVAYLVFVIPQVLALL